MFTEHNQRDPIRGDAPASMGWQPVTTVGIVGFGHVGKVMARLFPEAAIYDCNIPEYTGTRDAVNAADICFVCVPTPEAPDGEADISAVAEVVGWLSSGIIVIKSTVPPGATSKLRASSGKRVVFSPEYYGESRYHHPWADDPAAWPYTIVAGDPADTRPVIALLAGVLGPQKIYRQVEPEVAELSKYMENTWIGAQVLFAWQFGLLSEAFGVDYWECRELWALDPRVSPWHTALFDGAPGFGGKCLPKDIRAITEAGRAAGCDVGWLDALLRFNASLRNRAADDRDAAG